MNPELTRKAVSLEKEMEDVNEFIRLIRKCEEYQPSNSNDTSGGIIVIRPNFEVSLFSKFIGIYKTN